jgi:hypothetical protein
MAKMHCATLRDGMRGLPSLIWRTCVCVRARGETVPVRTRVWNVVDVRFWGDARVSHLEPWIV